MSNFEINEPGLYWAAFSPFADTSDKNSAAAITEYNLIVKVSGIHPFFKIHIVEQLKFFGLENQTEIDPRYHDENVFFEIGPKIEPPQRSDY